MPKTLLIIDDSKSILSVVSNIFSDKFNVVKKLNGKEALDWLEAGNQTDIIVSDLVMPELDGFELLTHLKNSDVYESIPVIILSSTDNTVEKVKCLKMGADDYVVKPFNPEELDARVHNIIKRVEKIYK